jgi:two-component system OmpR family response regulator
MREAMAHEAINLVLLDLNLPREDGLSLARELRQKSTVPIIMLTGKGDLIDRVAGLEIGADDYITKPFELRELLARVRTVMRRAQPSAPVAVPSAADPHDEVLVFDGWRLDLVRRRLSHPTGESVLLTARGFDLLSYFALHPNRVLSRDQLLALVRGRIGPPLTGQSTCRSGGCARRSRPIRATRP